MIKTSFSEKHYQALDGLYDYMSEILALYRDIIPMLKSELTAIAADDTVALDTSMKAQQAIILQTKYFSEKMAEFSKDIEVPNTNLRVLAEGLPGDEGNRFKNLHDEYETVLQEVLFYRNKCKELLSSKLYGIERRLDAMGGPTETTTYNNMAGEVQTSLFPKSFHTNA